MLPVSGNDPAQNQDDNADFSARFTQETNCFPLLMISKHAAVFCRNRAYPRRNRIENRLPPKIAPRRQAPQHKCIPKPCGDATLLVYSNTVRVKPRAIFRWSAETRKGGNATFPLFQTHHSAVSSADGSSTCGSSVSSFGSGGICPAAAGKAAPLISFWKSSPLIFSF